MVWDGLGRILRKAAHRGTVRAAFSLPELMIALVILALGLLIIAAALPVGLSYTQESVNLTNAEAAGEYALDSIEEYLQLWDLRTGVAYSNDRFNPIFRPYDEGQSRYTPIYEPLIKVRPLVVSNLEPRRTGGLFTQQYDTDGESVVYNWLSRYGVTSSESLEFDYRVLAPALTQDIAISLVPRVYPPLNAPMRRYPSAWLGDSTQWYSESLLTQTEFDEAVTRQILWTAFYRRVSYNQPGPDAAPGTPDDIIGDPSLYEIIVVVVRRPSERHRFALQEIGSSGNPPFDDPRPKTTGTGGLDRIAPVPWLVCFDASQPLPTPPIMTYRGFGEDPRIPSPTAPVPAQLKFSCKPSVGRLLPVGSIFIPARNDVMPGLFSAGGVVRNAGFAPHDPHALPIYRVIDRPDETTVIVENSGVYPWVNTSAVPSNAALEWPVWVIPPAHVERDSAGQPVFDARTTIIGVSRRYVRLPEFVAPQQ